MGSGRRRHEPTAPEPTAAKRPLGLFGRCALLHRDNVLLLLAQELFQVFLRLAGTAKLAEVNEMSGGLDFAGISPAVDAALQPWGV